jgi:hypothetical protein
VSQEIAQARTKNSSASNRRHRLIPLRYGLERNLGMHDGIRERVEALRLEIAELQRLNLEYLQRPRPDFGVQHDHTRREQRLREIMDELKSMTAWKKP